MIVALAQINPIVGDIVGNCGKIADFMARARQAGADLVVFPELAVSGYPPKDLLLRPSFVAANSAAVSHLAPATSGGPAALVGYVSTNHEPVGRRIRNSQVLLAGGREAAVFHKSLLPTYDVFDEDRYFEPAARAGVATLSCGGRSVRLGVTICEDLWNDQGIIPRRLYHRNPMDEVLSDGAEVVVNASASPYEMGKQAFREELLGRQAAARHIPLIFVNQVGGNDELIFDGASCVFDASGRVAARARSFAEDLLVVDLERLAEGRREAYPEAVPSVWEALVLGTRDYLGKCGFRDAVLGLSGGIDSAVTACIAVDALGARHVFGVALPSRYSSDHSIRDAETLAASLGIDFRMIPINTAHEALEASLRSSFEGREPDVTEENVQARIRGNLLMALSNKFGWLLLTTGNKSELAVGYCTLYGDMCGGLAVISDVPKTLVYELARDFNTRRGADVIPVSSLEKPPSAELRPNQTDQDSIPPYDVLDAILHRYVEDEQSVREIIDRGFDEATVRRVARLVDLNEYKRKQAATGLKVTSRAFGVGRRMPIAARFA